MKPGTPSDQKIYLAASMIIEEYGEDAEIHAAMIHDALLENGDVVGVIVWGRIVEAIREMCAEVEREGAVVH